jgi:hypothetical protein
MRAPAALSGFFDVPELCYSWDREIILRSKVHGR